MFLEVTDAMYWEALKKTISKIAGFNCNQYSDRFLQRRIEVRLRALNINSYVRYSQILDTDLLEKDKLLKELTIHVTHFFRDIDFYNAFENEVIPELIRLKKEKNSKTIRVWSAGCSTGEEPYSILICFLRKLGLEFDKYDIKVIGTDYDANTIEAAKKGIYEDLQFREAPLEIKQKYFTNFNGEYVIKDFIKSKAEFSIGDILSSTKPIDIDIIFCRNTVIYFDIEAKSKLYTDFYRILNNRGFFIMGKTETLTGPARDMFIMYNTKERIYRKELKLSIM